jgi:hypothetical protein
MRYETEQTGRRGHPDSATDGLARGLGWFSIGLGLTEILAPRALTRSLGMPGYEPLVVAYGVREVVKGVGILASDDPTPWIWGRVAGDALDLATLGAGLHDDNPKKDNVGLAMLAVLGVTALDFYTAKTLSSESPKPLPPQRDYSDRTGMPKPPEAMRGAATDFEVPPDFRTPELLRPYNGRRQAGDGNGPAATAH